MESTEIEYISDNASNDSFLLTKYDGNFSTDDRADSAFQKVIDSAEPPQHCPICKAVLPNELSLVNQHIDECLNRFNNTYKFLQL